MTCATWAALLPARPATAGPIPSGSAASATSSAAPRPRSRRFSPNNQRRKSKSVSRSLPPPGWGEGRVGSIGLKALPRHGAIPARQFEGPFREDVSGRAHMGSDGEEMAISGAISVLQPVGGVLLSDDLHVGLTGGITDSFDDQEQLMLVTDVLQEDEEEVFRWIVPRFAGFHDGPQDGLRCFFHDAYRSPPMIRRRIHSSKKRSLMV